LLTAILDNGAPLVIGRAGRSITFPNTAAGVAAVIEYMPGGGPADKLLAGDCIATYSPVPACIEPYLHGGTPGQFNNVFIGQHVALSLNTRLQGGALLGFVLQPGWLVTQSRTGCGAASVTLSCASGGDIISRQMNNDVINFLICKYGSATVANLLSLANDLLGGVLTPGQSVACMGGGNGTVPSYSAVAGMEGALNEVFDECRTFLGFYYCEANCANFNGGANNPPAIVNAGPDQNIGTNLTAQLAGQVSGGAATGVWSGGTTASFNPNRNALNAIYTPTGAERTVGTLVLTLTADPAGPCPAVSDNMTITMLPVPTINGSFTTNVIDLTGNENVTGNLNVTTYPNPFRDRVKFVFTSPVSGHATLEVYNMVGQKVQTLYNGELKAGVTQMADYRSPLNVNQSLIYKFRVGDKMVTGKLINLNK
jgi:hypothetical protein